ncbi:MAG: mechanosensitive ion channel family protein [Nannocystaceae bacterium]|nr:mechanosensitive ion channel family protein [bacterium]
MRYAPEAPEAVLSEPVSAIWDKLQSWGATALEMLPNLGVALVIVVLSVMLSKAVARWACRGLKRTDLSPQLRELITSVTRLALIVLGLVLALNALALDKAVATALAGVGVVGLALGFAFQDIAANFMAGVIMSVKQPFAVGDTIATNSFVGTVEHVGLRATSLRKFTGELVLIPNRKIFAESLTNNSEAQFRRIDVPVGVSYADDLDLAEQTAMDAVSTLDDCASEKPVQVFFQGFGGSSIDLEVRFWVPYGADPGSYLRGKSEAIKAIKKAFDEAGLSIPFPIRTLDFGIEGGQTLQDEVKAALDGHNERPRERAS